MVFTAMVKLEILQEYLDKLLNVPEFPDYAPNGLQVEGGGEIARIAVGVTASLTVIEAAVAMQADAILVHHGYFWKNENPCVTGIKKQRLQLLLNNNINLLAYHLPLDAHPRYGNNVRLAAILDIQVAGELGKDIGDGLVLHGNLPVPMSPDDFCAHVEKKLGRRPLHLPGGSHQIQHIAWCSGAAQTFFEQAAYAGVDAYLTGEVSEATTHIAHEAGTHFFAAGHHATERYGIQALGEHLQDKFSLECRYMEISNPV